MSRIVKYQRREERLMNFEGYEVEVFEFNGQVLFNPKHVGVCLDLAGKTISNHVSEMNQNKKVKLTNSDSPLKGIRKLNNAGENFITESGVYDLIFKSRKASAIKFKDWVTDEVLPSIRKHGMYAKDELLDNPDLLIDIATKLKEELQKRKLLEEEQRLNAPKMVFADAVTTSKAAILVGELSKILRQNGINTGQQRLFEWMRDNGYLIKRKGTDYNMPTQYSMELGLFEIKETPIIHTDGHITISKTSKVTGKGQQYFINKFISKKI